MYSFIRLGSRRRDARQRAGAVTCCTAAQCNSRPNASRGRTRCTAHCRRYRPHESVSRWREIRLHCAAQIRCSRRSWPWPRATQCQPRQRRCRRSHRYRRRHEEAATVTAVGIITDRRGRRRRRRRKIKGRKIGEGNKTGVPEQQLSRNRSTRGVPSGSVIPAGTLCRLPTRVLVPM